MAEKRSDLTLNIPTAEAEVFRTFVANLSFDEEGNPTEPYGVEIIYEEELAAGQAHGQQWESAVCFDLWFDKPRTAYYFALRLQDFLQGYRRWEMTPAEPAPSYPQFLYVARSGTFLRYNSPTCFCLVDKTQLQVRREGPRELFKPDEVQVVDEELFLAAYHQTRQALQQVAKQDSADYQQRGSAGNEWFYCNPLSTASASLPQHLRLNKSVDEYGLSWQLLYAHDTRRQDPRRRDSTEAEFTQQVQAMLADMEAVATGQEGGAASG